MRALKLTILIDENTSISSLANTFGDYVLLGKKCRFIEFTFNSITMLSANHLEPIYNLIKTYEKGKPLYYKMFYLHDKINDTYSPISIHCHKGKWFTVMGNTGVEMNYSDSLNGLF